MVKPTIEKRTIIIRKKRRRIKAISITPALFTLGNLILGFAAIHFASRPEYFTNNPILMKWLPTNLALACYLVYGAMICDAIDGRLARIARTASSFGAQLDSLADVVSFGLAPAFIAMRLIMKELGAGEEGLAIVSPAAENIFGRFCWASAAWFLSCAAIRLARFTVETGNEEAYHLYFKGLPSPGAAGMIVTIALLNDQVIPQISSAALSIIIAKAIPWLLIILGILMVSRLPYTHLANKLLRGKKPIWFFLMLVFAIIMFTLKPKEVLAVAFTIYTLSGPIYWLWTQVNTKKDNTANKTSNDSTNLESRQFGSERTRI